MTIRLARSDCLRNDGRRHGEASKTCSTWAAASPTSRPTLSQSEAPPSGAMRSEFGGNLGYSRHWGSVSSLVIDLPLGACRSWSLFLAAWPFVVGRNPAPDFQQTALAATRLHESGHDERRRDAKPGDFAGDVSDVSHAGVLGVHAVRSSAI